MRIDSNGEAEASNLREDTDKARNYLQPTNWSWRLGVSRYEKYGDMIWGISIPKILWGYDMGDMI